MKLIVLMGLLFSCASWAQNTCDLSANNEAVASVNERFDRGMMRGEDHLVELTLLGRERMDLITDCVKEDRISGISLEEFKEVKAYIQLNLDHFVNNINESIRISIENDRIGMATQLMMERDLHLLETKNLLKKIDDLITKLS